MLNKKLFLLGAGLFLLFCACSPQQKIEKPKSLPVAHIIPKPVSLNTSDDFFQITSKTTIQIKNHNPGLWKLAEDFSKELGQLTGQQPKISDGAGKQDIILGIDPQISSGEGYKLTVRQDSIAVLGGSAAGVFYGLETLKQLMPLSIYGNKKEIGPSFFVRGVEVNDFPRFPYRGMHLDVARHFFPVTYIKKYLDLLALHKMNTFHWHLTDDQGWRIEIKKYPKLTEKGGWRKQTKVGHAKDEPKYDGIKYGGFYTQEEIREVVEYARSKFITVIPEIEMPGHSLAALTAYPELACFPKQFETVTDWGVFEDIFCPKEETFVFLQNVLDEVMNLFPSVYIHIGGDEAPKKRWKSCKHCQALMKEEGLDDEEHLQSYFIRRINEYLQANGRKLIGWDEILEGGLAEGSTVMSWRGFEGGIEAAKQGFDVIMTPSTHVYFDQYQSISDKEPLAIGGFTPLKKVYEFNPVPEELSKEEQKYILGAQGCVWTEYIPNVEKLEYMIFPRMVALGEVLWSPEEKDWDNFTQRLSVHLARLDQLNVNYAKHFHEIELTTNPNPAGTIQISLASNYDGGTIYYTLNGESPLKKTGNVYKDPITLQSTTEIKAILNHNNRDLGNVVSKKFIVHKGIGKKANFQKNPEEKLSHNAVFNLGNGERGSAKLYDGNWLGFKGNDMEVTLDFGKSIKIKEVIVGSLQCNWISVFSPKEVVCYTSLDGTNFKPVGSVKNNLPLQEKEATIKDLKVNFEETEARYLKVVAKNIGIVPAWHSDGGNKAWIAIDEVIVN